MRPIRCAVQTNLGSADDVARLTAFLERLGVPWVPLKVIPFDDTPPDVPADGAVVFYGSTTLMRNVARDGRWDPGVFFDEARFAFEAPAPVFVLDVGEVEEGLRVVETNCFNSAGFYWCDLHAVVRAVNAHLRRG